MADYQEYRRRVLYRRWRRIFITLALIFILSLMATVLLLWRRLHPQTEPVDAGGTLLELTLTGTGWDELSYVRSRGVEVLSLADGSTAMDFRMASVPSSDPVELEYFNTAAFVGDSLTQGMQIYDTGLPDAFYCAYKGVGPNAIVNGTTCTRADGVQEIPLEALAAYKPDKVYLLLGTNVLTQDTDHASFLAYYSVMLDMIRETLPQADIYVQSITPVRPEVSAEAKHAGMYRERFCRINNDLAALALEKGCYFLNLWEVLADENGDLKAEYAQPDGYHITPSGYAAWVEYLRTHTVRTHPVTQQTPENPETSAESTAPESAAPADSAAAALGSPSGGAVTDEGGD